LCKKTQEELMFSRNVCKEYKMDTLVYNYAVIQLYVDDGSSRVCTREV
jgi:hypothetical protein